MDAVSSGELVFENGGGNLLDCSSMGIIVPLPSEKVLGMTICSGPMYKPYNVVNSFFNGCWDPLVSQGQNAEFRASPTPSASHDQVDCSSYTNVLENQGTSSTSRLVQNQSDHSPRLLHFVNGSFSEINSFPALNNWHQFANSSQASDYPLEGSRNKKELNSQSSAYYCENFQDEGTMELSPQGKKSKTASGNRSQYAGLKKMNAQQEKDECSGDQNHKKQKPEQKPVANLRGKLSAKEVIGNSTGEEAPKENYVHVRGKRGQVTNSHSLAERVRRKRISERMKFLQELVPGCSKITGKAAMLDEIINYVLSLQRQVEFLSLKLAHVYPKTNVDIEGMLSRNTHHSQGGNSASLGDPEMSSSNHIPKEILQGALPATPSSNLQPPFLSQLGSIWHNELQSGSQMDFIANPILKLNG